VKRRLAILPLVAMAVFGLAACNSTTPGQGTAEPTGGGSPSTTEDSSAPSSGSGGGSLASVDPCSLVSSSEESSLGLTRSDADTVPGGKPCDWTKPVDTNGQNGYAVEIVVRPNDGLNDVVTQGFTVQPVTVGSHQGKQLQLQAGGSCSIAIGVGNSSRVDFTVTAGTDTNQACQVANELAKAAEPQLPAGS
jgi:hypothetical protein